MPGHSLLTENKMLNLVMDVHYRSQEGHHKSKGGFNDMNNFRTLCNTCNSIRSNDDKISMKDLKEKVKTYLENFKIKN